MAVPDWMCQCSGCLLSSIIILIVMWFFTNQCKKLVRYEVIQQQLIIYLWVSPFLVRFLYICDCRWWRLSHSIFVDGGACLVCFCCWQVAFTCLGHECQDLLSWVHAMECMGAQTRPRCILSIVSSERVLRTGSEPMLTPRGKSPLWEGQRRIEPVTLHQAGQWAQHATDWGIPDRT